MPLSHSGDRSLHRGVDSRASYPYIAKGYNATRRDTTRHDKTRHDTIIQLSENLRARDDEELKEVNNGDSR